jgi:Flp pilus assembly protein TadD
LHRQGLLYEAIVKYRKAISLALTVAAIHLNLGNASHAKGQLAEARAAFEKARDLFLAEGNALPASQIQQFLRQMGLQ